VQALVRERMKDWGQGMCKKLGKKMVELTGDYTPDLRALLAADVIIATPEKWDGISRSWQNRGYVQKVCLLIIDEIHLLGADRCLLNPPFILISFSPPCVSLTSLHLPAECVNLKNSFKNHACIFV